MDPAWTIEYYVSKDKTIPFEEFAKTLKTQQERANCYALIELLKSWGDEPRVNQRLTHTEVLCFGLRVHEIRDETMRIFYLCEDDARVIVVVDVLLPTQGDEFLLEICRKAEDYASDE